MKRINWNILFVLLFFTKLVSAKTPFFEFETGDLLFLDLDCGELCEAIEAVTKEQFGVPGPTLSHVGLLEKNGGIYVYEALPEKGVVRSSLQEVLGRLKKQNGFFIGRFRKEFRPLAQKAVELAQQKLGTPYDDTFSPQSSGTYCSKLMLRLFDEANHHRPFFRMKPMYFGKPGSQAHKIWDTYYQKRNRPMPEGKPGISPLGLYLQGKDRFFK